MKKTMTIVATFAILALAMGRGRAEDATPDSSDDATPPAAKKKIDSGVPSVAQLGARLLRARANLIDARAAASPDQEKIRKLSKRVQQLQSKLDAQRRPGQAVGPRGGRGLGAGPWGRGGQRGRKGAGWGQGRCGPGESCRATGDGRLGRGPGRGWGGGRGFGRGPGGWGRAVDPSFEADHDTIDYLVEHRHEIHRKVRQLSDGIRTVTESDNPDVAAKIQQHVQDMVARVEGGRPIRMRDPLFAAVFQNADKIHIEVEKTDKGVKVNETSDNPLVAKLLKAHASVVSLFLKNGWSEMPKDHAVPDEVDKQASAAHRGPGWQSHAGELPTSP